MRKTLSHNLLVSEVYNQLKFPVKVTILSFHRSKLGMQNLNDMLIARLEKWWMSWKFYRFTFVTLCYVFLKEQNQPSSDTNINNIRPKIN